VGLEGLVEVVEVGAGVAEVCDCSWNLIGRFKRLHIIDGEE